LIITNGAWVILNQSETINGTLVITTNSTLDFNTNSVITANPAVLNGTTTMEETKSGGVFSGSTLTQTAGTLGYGGSLVVEVAGDPLVQGDRIALFSAPTYGDGFNFAYLYPDPGSGLVWSTAGLFQNGSIEVVSPPTGPVTLTNRITGSLMKFTWPVQQGWRLVSQTNSLSTGLTSNGWESVVGGIDGSNAVHIDPAQPTVFFRLVYP
jgi:hypothetical protein